MKLPDSFDSLQEILNPGLPDLVPLSVAKQELSRLSQLLPALLEASGLKTIQTSEPDFLDIGILDNSPTPNVFITLRAEIAFKKIKPHQGAVIQTLKQGNLQPRDCAINTMACLQSMGLYVSSGKMAEDEVVILPLCKPGNNPTHVLLFRWWSSGWEEAASKWKIRRFTTVDAQTLQKGEAFKW